jgi:hypothetical protein
MRGRVEALPKPGICWEDFEDECTTDEIAKGTKKAIGTAFIYSASNSGADVA